GLVAAAVVLGLLGVLVPLLTGAVPLWAGIPSLLGLPLAYPLLKTIRRWEEVPDVYIKLSQQTLLLTLWFGFAPAMGLVLEKWVEVA
ncbi:MAG: hypothetical protein HY892_14710, partial [Deltaproteobacteria bacterium]|nr:hypothetical protein [Deltaproteobacteria bacterium]